MAEATDATLDVEVRERTGKGAARKLRAAGRIPGVLYGRGKPSVAVGLDPISLEKALARSESGMNTLFDLRLRGDGQQADRVVMVKDLQRDPVTGFFLHADLYEVDLARTVEVEVPIHLLGEARGVEMDGGVLDQQLRELAVECLPRAIPDEIEVDVSGLEIGDSLHVADLKLPEGVTLREDPEVSVVSVVAPTKEEEAPAEEEAAAAEAPEAEAEAGEGEAPEAGGEDESKEGE